MRTRESVETEEGAETMSEVETKNQMKERKVSWAKLRRVDSLNLEAGRVSMTHSHGSQVTAMLYIHNPSLSFFTHSGECTYVRH